MALSSAVDRLGAKATEKLTGLFQAAGYNQSASLDGGVGSMTLLTAMTVGFGPALNKVRGIGGAAKGVPLTFDKATRSWTTPAGLVYAEGSKHGNRVKHILDHAAPNPSKPVHSVFNVDRSDVMGLVDEAWTLRQGPGVLQKNGGRQWDIDMGRVVGTNGQTSVRIIVKDGTTQVITAFPR